MGKFMHHIMGLLTACAVVVGVSVCCRPQGGGAEFKDIPVDSVCNGDIVFRRGRSFSSGMILAHDKGSSYSHIGIVCRLDTMLCVVHAVNEEPDFEGDFDRVKIEPLECFFSRERASAGAMYHSWVGDSLSAILTARAMQLARDSVRFDASFNHHDRSELYCTELVYHLYEGVGIDITQGRRTKVGIMSFPDEVIFPDDIQENKNIIKYFEF